MSTAELIRPLSPRSRQNLHQDSPFNPLSSAIDASRNCLTRQQHADGHWVAELQGDTILESEYILMMTFLGREKSEKCVKAANYLLEQQTPEGGWNNYPGGPPDLSTTVKGYFALKLTGHDTSAPYMQKARKIILSLGGAVKCNSFTRFYLALLGQLPYDNCPAVPPEMMFMPRWFYFNIYAMSSWTRTIVIPLSIFYAYKPVRRLVPEQGIPELFVEAPEKCGVPQRPTQRWLTWNNFFLWVNQILKWFDAKPTDFHNRKTNGWRQFFQSFLQKPLTTIRAHAVLRAAKWMLEHFEESDGVGAIFPPMIYTVIALRCMGYPDHSSEMIWAQKQLDDLMIEEGDTIRLQPCFSPVWDTAISLNALAFAGSKQHTETIARAVHWLLAKEVRRAGDWSLLTPELQPGGWFFEYHNGFYPDTDDTAMVLMALARTGYSVPGGPSQNGNGKVNYYYERNGHSKPLKHLDESARYILPVRRGLNWLLGMQNGDGGWAAFDRDINHEVLTQIPFADHNAMLDPSCPDITARVLEALGCFHFSIGHPQVKRAIHFIQQSQDPRGCWIGRWGVNYIYGTWQVLQGLESIGFDRNHKMVRRAVEWLKKVQQPNGGWGETCRSYDDPALAGQGETTASQTAWALLGLIAAGEAKCSEVKAGIDYLIATQGPDGNWQEEPFTGTGFPKVFYLKYHYYRLYFPLMALGRYQSECGLENKPPVEVKVSVNGHHRNGKPKNPREVGYQVPSDLPVN